MLSASIGILILRGFVTLGPAKYSGMLILADPLPEPAPPLTLTHDVLFLQYPSFVCVSSSQMASGYLISQDPVLFMMIVAVPPVPSKMVRSIFTSSSGGLTLPFAIEVIVMAQETREG